MTRQLHLAGFLKPAGEYLAGWRHPDTPPHAGTDIGFIAQQVQRLERACFDTVFLPDLVGVPDTPPDVLERVAVVNNALEPLTLLGALATRTERIGLIASASTSYAEPARIARAVATVDRLSQGRAGWNVVTSLNDAEARNHGRTSHLAHADRYERAERVVDAVTDLWGSSVPPWAAQPVLAQAGSSPAGTRLAARIADLVFTRTLPVEAAVAAATRIRDTVAEQGRDPERVLIMPELPVVVAPTRAEAEDQFDAVRALLHPRVALADVEYWLGRPLAHLPLDAPVPGVDPGVESSAGAVGAAGAAGAATNRSRGAQAELYEQAVREGLTIGGLVDLVRQGDGAVIGSPADVADHIEELFTARAADGFTVSFPWQPGTLDAFCDLVVPELQRRGLFRRAYEGATLRGHLGVA